MGGHLKLCPARMTASSLLIISFCVIFDPLNHLPVNSHSNKLAHRVPHNMPGNPTFCSFVYFSIVSLTPFLNK